MYGNEGGLMSDIFKIFQANAFAKSNEPDFAKLPEISVDAYIMEAMELYCWCREDMEALKNAGIDWNIAENIPTLSRSLYEAETRLFSGKFKNTKILDEWKAASTNGYKLRNIILQAMEFAYRNNPDLMAEVIELKIGSGSCDLIQNLKDISAFGKENCFLLKQVNYDINMLDKAAEYADKLNTIFASYESKEYNNILKYKRDEAYFLLKKAVDEIRAYGQLVFRYNEERLRGYLGIFNGNGKEEYYYNMQ